MLLCCKIPYKNIFFFVHQFLLQISFWIQINFFVPDQKIHWLEVGSTGNYLKPFFHVLLFNFFSLSCFYLYIFFYLIPVPFFRKKKLHLPIPFFVCVCQFVLLFTLREIRNFSCMCLSCKIVFILFNYLLCCTHPLNFRYF